MCVCVCVCCVCVCVCVCVCATDNCLDFRDCPDSGASHLDCLCGPPADREHMGEPGDSRGSQCGQQHTATGKAGGGGGVCPMGRGHEWQMKSWLGMPLS